METVEITYKESAQANVRLVVEALTQPEVSLDEFISQWLKDEDHSIAFWPAVNDEDPTDNPVGVSLRVSDQSVVDLYFNTRELAKGYGEIKPMTDYIRGVSRYEGYELDDEGMERYKATLGFTYSEVLCNLLGPKRAVVPYILSYLLTDGGSITITRGEDSWISYEDEDRVAIAEEGLDLCSMWEIVAGYESPTVFEGIRPGWGSNVFINLKDE